MSSSGKKFTGKVALVTGSSYGIGYCIARRLAQDGAHVMLSSSVQENLDKAVNTLKAEGLSVSGTLCNVMHEEQWQPLIDATVNKYGGIDFFISNAGSLGGEGVQGPVLDVTQDGWDRIWKFNVKSGFFLAKAAAAIMEKRGGGCIVFVTSQVGYSACAGCEILPGIGMYSVTKTALIGLIDAMAPQCAEKGIRVTGLAPGLIRTHMAKGYPAVVFDNFLERCPIKRIAGPEEMAGTVSFLCSEDASYITGETIVVNGGFPVRH